MAAVEPVVGQIESAERGRSGKSLRVKVNGVWYSSKNWELEQMVGQTVGFSPETSFYNGKQYLWLNKYDLVGGGTQAPQPPPQAGQPQRAAPPPQAGPTRQDPMALLPMTSNLVAHAIQAGLVKSPSDIRQWGAAAFALGTAAVNGDLLAPPSQQESAPSNEFDDDIPF